jgi:electron transfer flavoprotein alpha subunit
MSVLIVLEYQNEQLKKGMTAALAYGQAIKNCKNHESFILIIGSKKADQHFLGNYQASKIIFPAVEINPADNRQLAAAIAKTAIDKACDYIIFGNSLLAKTVAPRVAVRLQAGYLAGATSIPNESGQFQKKVFSAKVTATVSIKTLKQVILVQDFQVTPANIPSVPVSETLSLDLPEKLILNSEFTKLSGGIPLSEANRVISGGRGMKGPENWGLIEELANLTGAATACSRPIADAGWRPHHEHVGQTGQAIAPELYIAVGISGAIQHLAGVNRSKVIVVINKDPEAPFFKAADYGIVGDAFEVLPKIITALKDLG